MRVLQGATVAAMALAAGAVGAVTAYLACFVLHGASNPVHLSILHDEAEAANRATILSMNSLMASMAAGVGGIALGAVADGAGLTVAMVLGGVVLAGAAPLYLFAKRSRQALAHSVA